MKLLPVLLILPFVCCCSSGHDYTSYRSANDVLELLNKVPVNNADSMLKLTTPIFYADEGTDSAARLCAGIYGAQEFVLKEEMDSARIYLDWLLQNSRPIEGTSMGGMLFTVAAIYEIKANRDYPKGIRLFLKGYGEFEKARDIVNQVSTLVNIVSFLYSNSDIQGMEYAYKAYSLARSIPDDSWLKCASAISVAQMLTLSSDPADACPYIREADSLAEGYRYSQVGYMIRLLQAIYFSNTGQLEKAEKLFDEAVALAGDTSKEPGSVQLALIRYGEYCEHTGRLEKAMDLYGKGIEISYKTDNKSLSEKFMLHLSDCSMRMGDKDVSMYWYRKYLDFNDSLSIMRMDRETEEIMSEYRRMKHEYEDNLKDMKILEADRKIIIYSACIVILAVVSVSAIIIGGRRKKMYTTLVAQYRDYMKKTDSIENSIRKTGVDTAERDLWMKAELLMQESSLYRKKDLSLESMAEVLGTNRTYISRAINMFSGGDFYSYVNKYRIREAVRIIESSEGQEMPLKYIADKVGYNSLHVFHKVFVKETGLPPGKYREEAARQKQSGKSGG